MAFLLTWKNVLPVLLKSANALLQVPHRNFLPGSWGDSSSRGPKQANRSSETARNFLRSAFRLLRSFSANWTLENIFSTFNRHNYCHQNKILQQWRHFVFRDHVFTAQRPRACACIIPSCSFKKIKKFNERGFNQLPSSVAVQVNNKLQFP